MIFPSPKKGFLQKFCIDMQTGCFGMQWNSITNFFLQKITFLFFFKFYQVVIAQWLARLLATGEVSEFKSRQGRELLILKKKGIINLNLNCDMVYSIHAALVFDSSLSVS